MSRQPQSAAGGAFIALAILIGGGVGATRGQASLGVLAGAGLGIAIAVLLWLADRRRTGR